MNVNEIVMHLRRKMKYVSVAESCTGGMVAATLVDCPGVSDCFAEGYVTYSDEAKEKNLGVSHETLKKYGAVSAQTAEEMAQGVKRRTKSDYGLATTGIAGPDGGTAEKPVGLVYIACACGEKTSVIKAHFKGDRMEVRKQATEAVLQLLSDCLMEQEREG